MGGVFLGEMAYPMVDHISGNILSPINKLPFSEWMP